MPISTNTISAEQQQRLLNLSEGHFSDLKSKEIELHCPANLKGETRWLEESASHSLHVTFIQPDQQHEPPPLPLKVTSMPEGFLKQ